MAEKRQRFIDIEWKLQHRSASSHFWMDSSSALFGLLCNFLNFFDSRRSSWKRIYLSTMEDNLQCSQAAARNSTAKRRWKISWKSSSNNGLQAFALSCLINYVNLFIFRLMWLTRTPWFMAKIFSSSFFKALHAEKRSPPCKSPIPANPRHGTNWNGNWFIFILRHTLHRVERVWNGYIYVNFRVSPIRWIYCRFPQPECRLKYQQQQRMNRRNVNEVIMNGGTVLEVNQNQNWGRTFSYFKSYLQLNTPVNYHHETIKNVPTLECLLLYSVEEKWGRILSVSQGYFGLFCSVDGWGHYKLWIIYDASLLKEFKTEHANADDERESSVNLWAERRRVHFHSTAEKKVRKTLSSCRRSWKFAKNSSAISIIFLRC